MLWLWWWTHDLAIVSLIRLRVNACNVHFLYSRSVVLNDPVVEHVTNHSESKRNKTKTCATRNAKKTKHVKCLSVRSDGSTFLSVCPNGLIDMYVCLSKRTDRHVCLSVRLDG